MRCLAAVTILIAAALHAQVGTNAQQSGAPTFRSTTQLVIETVTVKGKDSNPIEGLTANDFTITEDGVSQQIKFFEFQKLDNAAPLPEIPVTQHPTMIPRLWRTQITSYKPGTNYRDRRLLALYFDLSGMSVDDQFRAFQAAKTFVRKQMTVDDLVSIMAFTSGSVQVLRDFTADRDALLSTIETLTVGEDENATVTAAETNSDTGAAFGQNDSEFNIFFTDRQLAALQAAANMLGQINEKKSLIYFASGLRLNGSNNHAQLRATVNSAVRAGVSFWPVDARGLAAEAPLGDARRGSAGGISMYTGAAANALTGDLQGSQDVLWTLAADTGGKALLDYNDLTQGITQAQKAVRSYYILGYYSTNERRDGKLRNIKITLVNKTKASLDYREGYYAAKDFSKYDTAEKERQLEDAFMLDDPMTEITIAMEIGYFQLNRAEYFVPLAVKIPGSELVLAHRGGAARTVIDFIGEIKDEFGTTVANLRDKVDIKLSGAPAAELARRSIQYDTGFTLLPGKYRIKFLARNAQTGRIGTYEMAFRIPNLDKEQARIPISSVVLSRQRVAITDAVFTAGKGKGLRAHSTSPLVQGGQKLLPSVTRVFSKSKEMYVFLEAYQQSAEFPRPLLAFVTFFRAGRKLFESSPLQVEEAASNTLRTMAIQFAIPLGALQEGEYVCQVTVIEATSKTAAFWQAPVMLVP